jgi:hypothetical protein
LIYDVGDYRGFGDQFMQEPKPFRDQFDGDNADTRCIAAGMTEAGNEAKRDGVGSQRKDDWNSRGCRLGRQRRIGTTGCYQDSDLTPDKIGRQRR